MNAEQILFILFGAVSLIGAIAVISFRHPIYSALSLIVTFFAQAGLFRPAGRAFRRGCPSHRLRRRDYGSVPLCDYALELGDPLGERGYWNEIEGIRYYFRHPFGRRRYLHRSECPE